MSTEVEKSAKPFPLFGILSILVPVLGFLCLLFIRSRPGAITSTENSNDQLLTIWTVSALGLIPILGAWIRHESYLFLRFIGLILLLPYLAITLIFIAFATSNNWHM